MATTDKIITANTASALALAVSDYLRTLVNPFIFGFTVYESFEGEDVAKTGIMQMPKDGEQVVGGHAVMAVGYDDVKRVFIVRNSWGPFWGAKGYFYMPFEYLIDSNLSDDFWTVRQVV